MNVYEETPQSVRELLEQFDKLDLLVRKIEMGNEAYWDGRSLMNADQYIEFCRPLAQAIRAHRPDIQIGACFGPVDRGNYRENWNSKIAAEDWFDAIVYHEYYGGQGFTLEKGDALSADMLLHPERLFDEPAKVFSGMLPDVPIWFTEWNIGNEALKQWKNTGAELLFIAAATNTLLRHHNTIPVSCFHQIHGTPLWHLRICQRFTGH